MPARPPPEPHGQRIESADMGRLTIDVEPFPVDLKAALAAEAKRQETSSSDLARQAIAFYLGWLKAQREAKPEPRSPPAPRTGRGR